MAQTNPSFGCDPERIRELQRKLYAAAKQNPKRKFHALYDRIHRVDILWEAWRRVRANRGSAGIDGETLQDIERHGEERFVLDVHQALREKRYHPRPVRRVYIPKPDGKRRPLGIPTVRDRVVQMAALIVLEPIFEADFEECSFGFRPRRSATEALERMRELGAAGYDWAVDADIQAFFDTIDHDKLMAAVQKRICDRRVLKLIRKWLKAGVMVKETGGTGMQKTEVGTPQGGVISPLLANIFLHGLDRRWNQESRAVGVLTRYADDFVIMTRNGSCAREGLRRVQAILQSLGLRLHPEKTRVVNLREAGIDFLGCHLRKLCSRRNRRRWWLYRWPNGKAMKRICGRIREKTDRRRVGGKRLDEVIAELNPVLRGWGAYFRTGNATRRFQQIDRYVWERLRLLAHQRQRGRARTQPDWRRRFPYAWFQALAVHRLSGTIRLPGYANAG
jgi:group II intron reverse transcriptase/maturase